MPLTIPTPLLTKVIAAIIPASAQQSEDVPSAFVETMRIDRDPADETLLRFYCTDGFRLHMVYLDEADKVTGTLDSPMVFGVEHLKRTVLDENIASEIKLSSDEDHTWWTASINGNDEKFQIPVWPDVDKLMGDDSADLDATVGFNLDYFLDFMDAATTWASRDADDKDEDEDTFPLEALMRTKGACKFSVRNKDGLLRIIVMPVVLKW